MNKPFELSISQDVAKVTDNYYQPLGMTEERARQLMDAVIAFLFKAMTVEELEYDLLDMFAELSSLAETKEELAFIMFKAGEYHGALEQAEEGGMAEELKMDFVRLAIKQKIENIAKSN